MESLTSRLAASTHPEAYTAADRPGARPAAELARPVDMDRRPARAPDAEPPSELAFADFLDVINPLQHIPVVGDIYRYLTGDQIAGPARVAGGALFGGPIGFVAGLANAIVAETSGGSPGELTLATLFGADEAEQAVAASDGSPAEPARVAASLSQDVQPALAAYHVPVAPALAAGRQPLTGAAALQALSADLSGSGSSGVALSALPGRPAVAADSGSAGIDARYVSTAPRGAFTSQVLEGLDKYKAMGVSPGRTLDQSL